MNTIIGIIIFIVLGFLGVMQLTRAFGIRRQSRIAQTWPTTQATVLESSLFEEAARSAIGNVNIAHILNVKYEFTVNGKQYQGERVCFGRPAYNYITGSSFLDQFAEGTQVPVFYNPSNPQDSVLAPKTTVGMPSRILGFFILISALVVGVYLILPFIKG